MADSVNYQHFKNLVEAYERAYSEKNKKISKTAVEIFWKKMKADFPAADEIEEVVRRQVNEWKTLSFTKKSEKTDFWSKAVQKTKSKGTNESLPTISQEKTKSVAINDKTNPLTSMETSLSATNTAAFTLLKRILNKKSTPKTIY